MQQNDSGNKSLKDELLEANKEPLTLKDRIIGILIAAGLIAFGVCTWLWPELIAESGADPSGRGGRKILFVLNLLWSRPVGSIGILLGIAAVHGALTKKSTGDAPE